MKISVVVPVYGCPGAVVPLCERVAKTVSQLADDYEIVLVNDCCPKGSWKEVQKACAANPHVVGVELSRNFGQIRAITAGLDYCDGDWVVVMDCDLQDRPEGIADLYAKAAEGYDVVFAKRKGRKDKGIVKFFSQFFYKVYNRLTDGRFDSSICNFSISRREVIDAYCGMREQNRAYTLFIKWLGFRQAAIDIDADKRYEGKSSYNFKRKINMATEFITSQSNKPLRFASKLGFLIAFVAFVVAIVKVIQFFVTGNVPSGWTSLFVSIFLIGGLILMALGIIGIYIGYVFDEVKRRPLYVVRSVVNGKKNANESKEEQE
ncbi:MAG: glycosyltransferase family 2 protein [Clostridia bacterium]|nr:glycosyltransferase family 2 protein [Clostridia bacterium]MBQ9558136.1 glycosyltransferase family 2 protein [Clostridia bacterium]